MTSSNKNNTQIIIAFILGLIGVLVLFFGLPWGGDNFAVPFMFYGLIICFVFLIPATLILHRQTNIWLRILAILLDIPIMLGIIYILLVLFFWH